MHASVIQQVSVLEILKGWEMMLNICKHSFTDKLAFFDYTEGKLESRGG